MASITRCKSCFNEVLKGAPECPHCGQDLRRRRRLITKGNWAFIIGVVVVFGVIDTVVLVKEKEARRIRDLQEERAVWFLRHWLVNPNGDHDRYLNSGWGVHNDLRKLREHADLKEVLPADTADVLTSRWQSSAYYQGYHTTWWYVRVHLNTRGENWIVSLEVAMHRNEVLAVKLRRVLAKGASWDPAWASESSDWDEVPAMSRRRGG